MAERFTDRKAVVDFMAGNMDYIEQLIEEGWLDIDDSFCEVGLKAWKYQNQDIMFGEGYEICLLGLLYGLRDWGVISIEDGFYLAMQETMAEDEKWLAGTNGIKEEYMEEHHLHHWNKWKMAKGTGSTAE